MTPTTSLDQLNTEQLRSLAAQLFQHVEHLDKRVTVLGKEVLHHKIRNQQLGHEIAQLKRHRFSKRAESFSSDQASFLDDLIDTDITAIEAELETLVPKSASTPAREKPKRSALPAKFSRTLIHHEPENTQCRCGCALKRIGEDVSEKLDYTPDVFSVERHVRGKWVCNDCEILIQAPVPAQAIDKGIPTASLLAQVMTAKYADHLPLYRQEKIFGRAGLAIPRSTLALWVGICGVQLQPLVDALREVVLKHNNVVHVDETPLQMLAPGSKKTHRAYVWVYVTTSAADIQAVVYEFSPGRSGEYARNFLGDWKGKLVCDDYGGYKASFALGVTKIGCMAHARRKFYELHVTKKSIIAEQALQYIAAIYEVEREVRDLEPDERRRIRQEKAAPLMEALHAWMIAQRELVFEGLIITRALDSLQTLDVIEPLSERRDVALRQQPHRAASSSLGSWKTFSLACPRSGQVKSESCCSTAGNQC